MFAHVRGVRDNFPMNQTGVRMVSGQGRIAALRAQIAKLEGAPAAGAAGEAGAAGSGAHDLVALPGRWAQLLPGGGLARRAVTELNDCAALAAQLLTDVTAAGGFVAVVGWPELSWAQVVAEGEPRRAVAVPDPGPNPWLATTALVEGMDVVIHRGAPGELSPTRARPLLAKLRAGTAALLCIGPHIPGTALSLRAEVVNYRGIGPGTGRIRGFDVDVQVTGKNLRRRGTLVCGEGRRLEAV